ncbi:uncharacterized protein Z518_04822 [Rhinocladiella mackenziei CBS 650.93]|uniref:Uncharacterized protein n=1 Tax=Rhinocladiella mackenziei CBS 650.93 TaxID=1442369 RepID=A0A0D2IUL1_9EURO|nr:uncharacterized protein Z518_04822 [Rhinocladiella mackenziei CBS 650.93]KIX06846.1 hypothetical protein Z518_04822 [Rhinocladiella mackenziei CBS 650.93]
MFDCSSGDDDDDDNDDDEDGDDGDDDDDTGPATVNYTLPVTALPVGFNFSERYDFAISLRETQYATENFTYSNSLARSYRFLIVNNATAVTVMVGSEDEDEAASSELSTGAKAGIGVGVALVVIILGLLGLWLYKRHRSKERSVLKRDTHPDPDLGNYGNTNDTSGTYDHDNFNPETFGSRRKAEAKTSQPYAKPELAANEQPHTGAPPTKHEMGIEPPKMYGSSPESVPAWTSTGSTLTEGSDGKQVLQSEKSISPLPEPTLPPLNYPVVAGSGSEKIPVDPSGRPEVAQMASTSSTDINVLKAQEREMAEALESDESLRRLKAEHAALQQRIAVAEMQAAEKRKRQALGQGGH